MNELNIRAFLQVAYPIFAVAVILSQSCLLFLIFKNKSKLLRSMRPYLLNICIAQLVTIFSGYFTQCRMISNNTTVAFICCGFCTKIGRNSCFLLHLLRDASSTATLFAIVHIFYYRYKILSHKSLSTHQIHRNFVLVHIPAIFCAICQFVNPSHHNAIIFETRSLHPSYIFESDSIFGFSALESPTVKASTTIFTVMIFANPIAAFIYQKKIWVLLNEYEEYNRSRIRHAKSMITGLTIQTLIPSICFIPLVAQFLVSNDSGISIMSLEYLNSFLVILPTLVDPLLSIVFVIPFRRMFVKYCIAARRCSFSSIDSSEETVRSQKKNYLQVPNKNVL